MSSIVLLDTGPLGMVTHPNGSDTTRAAATWLRDLVKAGIDVRIPEIADYELRRELIRAKKLRSIKRLDELEAGLIFQALSTSVMRRAAQIWADARNQGQPTASEEALDGDVILAAQAKLLEETGLRVTIATTNIGHLSRFANALPWAQCLPDVLQPS
jgi:predicted nucleic acid-binding protein